MVDNIKINLGAPVSSYQPLSVDWSKTKQADDELKLYLTPGNNCVLSIGDTIVFARYASVENGYAEDESKENPPYTWKCIALQRLAVSEITKYESGNMIVTTEVPEISQFEGTVVGVINGGAISDGESIITKTTFSKIQNGIVIETEISHDYYYQDLNQMAFTVIPVGISNDIDDIRQSGTTFRGYAVAVIDGNYNMIDDKGNPIVTTEISTQFVGKHCGDDEVRSNPYYFVPVEESRKYLIVDNINGYSVGDKILISASQNLFYCVNNGNCKLYNQKIDASGGIDNTLFVAKASGYWGISVGFSENSDFKRLRQEELINEYFAKNFKEKLIPPIIDMERVKYIPWTCDINGDMANIANEIDLYLHFRIREDTNWTVNNSVGWSDIDMNDPITDNMGFWRSNTLDVLNFTDDDVLYQKMKVKQSFVRLSFYNSNDITNQSLLYYSTVFLDGSGLSGKMVKKKNEMIRKDIPIDRDNAIIIESTIGIRIDSQIAINDEYQTSKSSEGFYLYLFKDDADLLDTENESGRTIYMKVEFNHAGYGRTIPMMLNPINDDYCMGKLNIENFFENMFIPLKIYHDENGYRYSFENNGCIRQSGDKIELSLFEPYLQEDYK